MEERLALLEALFRHAPIGFAFIDREFRHVRINDSLAAINGRSVAEHIGRTVQEMVPELWPVLAPIYARVFQGEVLRDQEVVGRSPADPTLLRHWSVSYFPVRHQDAIVGAGVIVADITERRRAARELAIRNELYAMLSRAHRAINRCRSAEQLYREICAIAVETGRFKFAWVGVPSGDRLQMVACAGQDDGYMHGLVIPLDDDDRRSHGPTGRAALTGRSYFVNDFMASPMTAPWHEHARRVGFAASAALPFHQGGTVAGVLTLYAAQAGFFTDQLVATLGEVLPSVSFALDGFVVERERQQVEAALQASELRNRSLIDSIPALMWVYDAGGHPLLHNRRWYDYTGQTPDDLRAESWTEALHPDDVPEALQQWARSKATGEPYSVQYRLRGKDGRYRWFLSQADLVVAPDGARRWVGVCADIDDRKQAEDARRSSEARFRAFMDNSPTLAWIVDENDRFVFANAAFHRIIGRQAGELTDLPLSQVMPDAALELYLANNRRVRATGEPLQTTERGPRADGSLGEYLVHKFPVPSTERGGLVGGVAIDVTDQRRAEAALRIRDRAMRAIGQGIMICDASQPDTPTLYASPSFTRMTGYEEHEVLGRNCRFLQGKDTDPAAVAIVREALREGHGCKVELLNYRKDGTPFWNELAISPVTDADGRLTHFIGVQTDVTERRRLEEQIRQAQKLEAVGQLAGGVAHDFNNWLTVIYGCTDLLLGQQAPDDPQRALLVDIRRAAEQAGMLTRQLLAFSRQQVLDPRVIDLNSTVQSSAAMLRRLVGEHVQVTLDLAAAPADVHADQGQIEQVLLNLALNARDAMPRGGNLHIATANVAQDATDPLGAADVPPGQYVQLQVADTGVGMDRATLARIFEPFFTTKAVGKGTGLGLAMVHSIVRQSHGHVVATSELGRGTRFRIFLPRVSPISPADAEPLRTGPQERGHATILLVEDENTVRKVARRVLEGCGYTILEASDGAEALRVAAAHPGRIDLLLSDVVMPNLGGRELAERMRTLRPECKVLLLSGYTDDDVVRRGVLQAEFAFLQKPFTPTVLIDLVRRLLANDR